MFKHKKRLVYSHSNNNILFINTYVMVLKKINLKFYKIKKNQIESCNLEKNKKN